jgi:hypothetical protein
MAECLRGMEGTHYRDLAFGDLAMQKGERVRFDDNAQ